MRDTTMRSTLRRTMHLPIVLFLCAFLTFTPGHCQTEASNDDRKAKLPEFISELDLASLEASEEDVEALKKVVKRLAPSEKNGEYQVFQGVTGQPGVDFPALTTIPVTSFSCRGLKGGYYADLETNCQVFHICDNGRKISFLCPNGTIFQQSQLICDWWFKVDCGKSTELYEQSAEQLAEEEKKRVEAKRMNSEFHRTSEKKQDFGQSPRPFDYDGRQNGRMNPYGQSSKPNQIPDNRPDNRPNNRPDNRQTVKSGESLFAQGNAFERGSRNEYRQSASLALDSNAKRAPANDQLGEDWHGGPFFNGYSSTENRQENQSPSDPRASSNFHRDRAKYQDASYRTDDYYGTAANRNAARREKPKKPKIDSSNRNSVNNFAGNDQKVTPPYTETTTFRTTTSSPVREFQQLAESAAFVSNRGNRWNDKAFNPQQYRYRTYTDRATDPDNGDRPESTTSFSSKNKNEAATVRTRFGIPPFPGPTFAPIYKPRTTTTIIAPSARPYEPTALQPTSTAKPADNGHTDYHAGQNYQTETTYAPYSTGNRDYETTTEAYYSSNSAEYYNGDNSGTTASYDDRAQTTQAYRQNYYRDYDENDRPPAERTTRTYSENYYGQTSSYGDNTVTGGEFPQKTVSSFPESQRITGSNDPPAPYFTGTHYLTGKANDNVWPDDDRWITTTSPPRTLEIHRQNSISASTDKPSRSTQSYKQSTFQQNAAAGTAKTLSPYDTSFTYKQGKVMSTLGPYVPFTKNYVYPTSTKTTATATATATATTTTTTQRAPVYTATVPTYASTRASASVVTNYRASVKNVAANVRSTTPSPKRGKTAATYLPETSTKRLSALDGRPETEREHALSMLHSLKCLRNNTSGTSDNADNSAIPPVINVPPSTGPSTLHSLALYFATANDSYDPKEATDTAVSVQYQPASPENLLLPRSENSSIELPTSILTRHTVNSYADLFNLNNALEGNATGPEFNGDEDVAENESSGETSGETSGDLDIEQSQGPLNGANKSNGTKLRELARVFTHALSAYLQDPETFKKVLTEIRPTEPTFSTINDEFNGTTPYSTTVDEYPSVTKEKDEVLDFSDDTNGPVRRKPTTLSYGTTLQTSPTITESTRRAHYTTSNDHYTAPPTDRTFDDAQGSTYFRTTTAPPSNAFAFAVNGAFSHGSVNDLRHYDGKSYGSSDSDRSRAYSDYFPPGYSEKRIAGFQNNTANTFAPYGKYVKPSDATPIHDNYVASSTPASYNQEDQGTVVVYGTDQQPRLHLTPPLFQNYENTRNSLPSATSFAGRTEATIGTTAAPIYASSSTNQPFRIRYYEGLGTNARDADPTTTAMNNIEDVSRRETTTVARRVNDDSRPNTSLNGARSSDILAADHWTSSPEVTQLWESTVFIDPKRINQAFEADGKVSETPFSEFGVTERVLRGTTPPTGLEAFTDSNQVTQTRNDKQDFSTPWQWAPNDNDTPTAFTLLPTALNAENAATPTPIYTTSSSITTTITSSVTSSGGAAQTVSTLLPIKRSNPLATAVFNATENEIAKAQEMFGKLNLSSANTLMKVMRQADKNATVRRLILLLVSHCNAPTNKSTEQEKEQLLNALLKMPVNEFSSDESREIVTGIDKLNLSTGTLSSHASGGADPDVKSVISATASAPTTEPTTYPTADPTTHSTVLTTSSTKPFVTTFRSRKGRKFRTSTASSQSFSRRSDESKVQEFDDISTSTRNGTTAADSRALELLRSLYTIAAKWG